MKRKLFKRLMAASLATVMVAGMAGCGGNSEQPAAGDGSGEAPAPSESGETPAPSEDGGEVSPYTIMKDENGNVYDLGGMSFKVYSWFGKDLPQSDYGDAVAEYREWAQKTYNFTMEWDGSGGWGDNFQKLSEQATGGLASVNNEYRMCMIPAGQGAVMAAIKEGLIWDLSSLGVVDLSEHRFANNGLCDAYTINGGVYALEADYPEPREGVFFNKELLEQTTGLTADDIYDLQKNNEWTWDKFDEICQKVYENGDTDNDGTQDIYALACNKNLLNYLIASNGGMQMFDFVDGKFVNNSQDPAVVEAFDQFMHIIYADYWYPQPPAAEGENNWDYFYAAFDDEGKIVFMPEQAYHLSGSNRLVVSDETNAGTYGFVMFPMGPKANGKYYNLLEDNPLIIPKCYNEDEAKKILLAYSLWTAEVPGYENYNYRVEDYEAGVSDNRILTETLPRMMSEGVMSKAPGVPGIDVGADTEWYPKDKTAAEMIDACQKTWQTAVDDANK